ncbi:hypothetical protein [Streptomyces sp. 3N207]|uniref:hypothetical protein n=1 Tax=Streptomyces sp. 3N207 TaxID=3457417 RepID=UPI003FD17A19
MRRRLTKAVVMLVGIAAFAGLGATTAQAADDRPTKIKMHDRAHCEAWGKLFVNAGKIKGYRCVEQMSNNQMYLIPIY